MAQIVVRLTLLIDTKGHKVLFAEADKKVLDFLFHQLSLPLGTTCKLLQEEGMVGCLENMYKSVEALDQTYFQPDGQKRRGPFEAQKSSHFVAPLTNVEPPIGSTNLFTIRSTEKEGGYVKGVVSYMVMDDLGVMPMSTISCVTLSNKFKNKKVGGLEEKRITLDVNKGVKLLKASR